MRKPKLIHYNDARHYSIYRYEPPMSLHQWRQPVDEILGTDVDILVYGLGSGETFLHGTKAGLKWGEGVEEHNMSMMWWRATKNLNLALEAGIDPLAVAVERAHEKGRRILGSLRMTEPTSPDDDNPYMLGRLKREHPEVMIGEHHPDYPRAAGCADYTRDDVRAERLAVIEEVCGRYGMDGLEFDPYVGVFFKPSEATENAPVLTEFVREIRQLLDRLGEVRGESLSLAVRVRATEEANLALGMDVRAWLEEGLLDIVIPWTESFLFDQEMPIEWVVEAAAGSETPVYPMLGRSPYDDRHHLPTVEMYPGRSGQLPRHGSGRPVPVGPALAAHRARIPGLSRDGRSGYPSQEEETLFPGTSGTRRGTARPRAGSPRGPRRRGARPGPVPGWRPTGRCPGRR